MADAASKAAIASDDAASEVREAVRSGEREAPHVSRKPEQGEENGDRQHQEDDRHRKRQALTVL
jgi:hypothetical protein